MKITEFKHKANEYTKNGIPYLFIIDFELKKPFICKLNDLKKENIYYQINKKGNLKNNINSNTSFKIKSSPISKSKYFKVFNTVKKQLNLGNSYLLNLTFSNPISIQLKKGKKPNLKEILASTNAKYKLFFKNQFISFSPESFIKIKNDKIYTYPMKGTIDAEIDDAKNIILNDVKETQEHNTIVDLLRNDLSIIATKVNVDRFRFLDKIKTNKGAILQVSSEISGVLPKNWKSNFGDLILKILPAGSISGAPKNKTLEIITAIEKTKRGYYTGVFGVFDGKNIDSAVLIRYIEKNNDKFAYRSGGGITYLSDAQNEYNELLQKIYLPK